MDRYRNLNGRSGVLEIGDDFIKVQFKKGGTYLYTYRSASKRLIDNMKILALKGHGLNTCIDRYVKRGYVSKKRL
jgi:hypothetical protein